MIHVVRLLIYFAFAYTFTISIANAQSTNIPAFPGAEGFGAKSVGGRGGTVYEVTNLDDNGSGSLRECVEASGPRTCVFRTGGTINLNTTLKIKEPYITIAGQTAPGGGITLQNDPSNDAQTMQIMTHDVIVRYVRLRTGASIDPTCCNQSLAITQGYNIIIDHVSASWSTDQILTIYTDPITESIKDVTVQWSFLTEALQTSTHPDGPHSTAAIISSNNNSNISLHHNLFAHNDSRHPRIGGVTGLDVVNNLIYNYGRELSFADSIDGPLSVNYIGNRVIQGPNSKTRDNFIKLAESLPHPMGIYVQGNIDDVYRTDDTLPEYLSVKERSRGFMLPNKIYTATITTHSCNSVTDCQVYNQVLSNAGSNVYVNALGQYIVRRDAVDKRIIQEVINREGRIIDATSASTAYNSASVNILQSSDYTKYGINDPIAGDGWPVLASGTAPDDQDHDGMPDVWEEMHHFDPNVDSDNVLDADQDGYTNLEEYLNGTDPGERETIGDIDFGSNFPMSLGNRVWSDKDDNGTIDEDEIGISGVALSVYLDTNADGMPDSATPIGRDVTDFQGYYLFDGLTPGSYVVAIDIRNFESEQTLEDFINSNGIAARDADREDSGLDSLDPNFGILSNTITLNQNLAPLGESDVSHTDGDIEDDSNSDLTIDFGFLGTLMSIGNRVWIDESGIPATDFDGILNGAESGIANVVVNLYRDPDNDGTPNGNAIASDITNADGYYLFDGIPQGNYVVGLDRSNFTEDGVLFGYISTVDGSLNNDNIDNGVNESDPQVIGILSNTIQLRLNSAPTSETDLSKDPVDGLNSHGRNAEGDNNSNLTVDFGLFKSISIDDGASIDPDDDQIDVVLDPDNNMQIDSDDTNIVANMIANDIKSGDHGSILVTGYTSGNNNIDAPINIMPPSILNSVEPPFALPGNTVTWVITVNNNTNRPISDILISDNVPSELVILGSTSTSGRLQVVGQNVSLSQNILDPGKSIIINIETKISENVRVPFMIDNTARVTCYCSENASSLARVLSILKLPSTGQSRWYSWNIALLAITLFMASMFGVFSLVWRKRTSSQIAVNFK